MHQGVELLSQSYGDSMFNFLRYTNCFTGLLYHFTFPPVIYDGSNFSTSSPILIIYSHPSGYTWYLIVILNVFS